MSEPVTDDTPTPEEARLIDRWLTTRDPEALADLFELGTGVRPTIGEGTP